MKILIIEGIVTSGKSSLADELTKHLGKSSVRVYGESETHEPIMNKKNDLHIEFFKSLIGNAAKDDAELTIFDRFHFTQALRANASTGKYSEIEDLLARQKTLVVYLKVDESVIADRIRLAAEHRDNDPSQDFRWDEYFHTKGKTYDEIAKHYVNQQRGQIDLLKQSKLESRIFNTTRHEYHAIANQIIKEWFNSPT